ncbi:MAG TPA: hypothetical protein VJI33_05295 [Candidatus Paceibacterota bacterium]
MKNPTVLSLNNELARFAHTRSQDQPSLVEAIQLVVELTEEYEIGLTKSQLKFLKNMIRKAATDRPVHDVDHFAIAKIVGFLASLSVLQTDTLNNHT